MSWAEWGGFAALGLAASLALPAPAWAALPLAAFLLACFLAPFFPGWGFFYPVIGRLPAGAGRAVALTFDDGPDPRSTPLVLARLAAYGFVAVFFVNGKRARRHPDLIRAIARQGHVIGDHSYSHEPCVMFRGPERLLRELLLTRRALARAGARAELFRPPVGINVPAWAEALHQCGLTAVNFSIRPRDLGNRRVRGLARRILKRLRPGDIVLLHDAPPKAGRGRGDAAAAREAREAEWLAEMDALFAGIRERGYRVLPPAAAIDPPAAGKACPPAFFC